VVAGIYGSTAANGALAVVVDANGILGTVTASENTQYNTSAGVSALASNTTGQDNTGSGWQALFGNTTGNNNTATGASALQTNSTGYNNTANGTGALFSNMSGNTDTGVGYQALFANTTGIANTAVGNDALSANTTGGSNTAAGDGTLSANTTGSGNAAIGSNSLLNNTTGSDNVALGQNALQLNTTGNGNIAVGYGAGSALTSGGGDNIDIGNAGVSGESGIIRIGTNITHTAAYMAGVDGVTVSGGIPVYIDPSTGQLGTVTSSQRYKRDIQDMGDASEALLSLRPVTYRYRQDIDPKGTPQFGLVAEEVERVAPELVVHDASNRVYTVRYDAVNAMLLNEFRKQHAVVLQQQQEISALQASQKETAAQRAEIEAQREELAALKQQFAALAKAVAPR
jgi:hypothetical protein